MRRTLLAAAYLLLSGPAFAADRTWSATAVSPGNWSTGSNWAGGVGPVSGDNVTFVNSSFNTANQNVQSNFVFGAMTFAPSVSTFTVSGSSFATNGGDATIQMNSTGSVQINNAFNLNAGYLNVVGSGTGTVTLSGAITGYGLNVGDIFGSNSPVTVVLTSTSNTYGGTGVIGGAILKLGANSVLPPMEGVTVTGGSTIDIGTTGTTAATAPWGISLDSSSMFKVGAGNSGNFYMGGFTLTGGTVTDAGLSNGITFHLTGGGVNNVIYAGASQSGPSVITLANGGKLINDSGAVATINVVSDDVNGFGLDLAASLSAAGNNSTFQKIGSGTLRLLGAANTANIALQAGRLRFDALNTLTSGTVTLDGGMLGYYGPTATLTKTFPTTNNGGTVEVGLPATTLTLNSAVSGGGAVTKSGPGTLVYAVPMTYTGDTTVADGTLRLGTANTLSSSAGLSVNGTGTFDLNGQTVTTSSLTLAGGGTAMLNGGTLTTGAVNLGAPVVGPGTLSISGPLTVTAANVLNTPVHLNMLFSASVTTGAFPVAIGSLSSFFGGSVLISSGGSLTVGLDNTSTSFAGVIYGPGSLTKVGTGVLTLSGGNTFGGGLVVNGGAVSFQGDTSLGVVGGSVIVNPAGKLVPDGNVNTTRTYSLNGGTLEAPAGVTLQYQNGAAVWGGFLRGAGTHMIGPGGVTFAGTTAVNGVTISQPNPLTAINFTNGGALTSGATLTWDGGLQTGAGSLAVSAAANVKDFESDGTITVNAGGTLANVGTSPLVFGGGSTTFIGRPNNNGGVIDLGGQPARVRGGLLVNNGAVVDSGPAGTATIVADFGSLVKGAGFFQNSVQTVNGGKFQSGNSPGKASFGSFTFGPGGVSNYVFAIDDASGTAGPSPDMNGQVSGWGLVKTVERLVGGTTTTGDFAWTATPTNKLTVSLETLVNPTTVGTDVAGPMADFDPASPYSWLAASWTGNYCGPSDSAALDASTAFDTGGFLNPIAGTFGWGLDTYVHSLSLTYTPSAVPDPGTLTLTGLAGLGLCLSRRRRKAIRAPRLGSASRCGTSWSVGRAARDGRGAAAADRGLAGGAKAARGLAAGRLRRLL